MAAVSAAAVIVKLSEVVCVDATSTEVGSNEMPVAVGVSVRVPPSAAWSIVNVTLDDAVPPAVIDVASLN